MAVSERALRGELIDIGDGRRLHAVLAGPAGSPDPLVLLEAGAFGFSADWAAVQVALAAAGFRSLAYDRAGLGRSDLGPSPRDGLGVVRDIETLLAALGESGLLIPCGHSMAGLYVRLFALRNPARIVGLVLVDAATPEATDSGLMSTAVDHFGHLARAFAWGAGTGLFKPLASVLGNPIGLEGSGADEKRWAFGDAGHNQAAAEEVKYWQQAARQAREAGELVADWPIAVVTAGGPDGVNPMKTIQVAPARASRAGIVEHAAGASHATVLNATFAPAIVRGVRHVRDAAWTGRG